MTSEERLSEAKKQIRERLRKVCSHLDDDEFERLVHKIALNEVKTTALWTRPERSER